MFEKPQFKVFPDPVIIIRPISPIRKKISGPTGGHFFCFFPLVELGGFPEEIRNAGTKRNKKMNPYFRLPALGLVFVVEVAFAARRPHFAPARCRAQSRCSWQALFTFALVAADDCRWAVVVATGLLFLLAWGRVQHLALGGWKRQAAWAAGAAASAGAAAFPLIWVGVWALLLVQSLVSLCYGQDYRSMEYEHLVWAHLLYLGAVLPLFAAEALAAWAASDLALARAAVLVLLYLRLRLPVVVRSVVFPQSYLKQFGKEDNPPDARSVYEALEEPRALARYLSKVGAAERRCLVVVEEAHDAYVRGLDVTAERLALVEADLKLMGIDHTAHVVLLRQTLLAHMHRAYGWKIFGPLARLNSLLCPCAPMWAQAPALEDGSDPGSELDSDVTLGSDERDDDDSVVYVEFGQAFGRKDQDGTPLIPPDGGRL